MAIRSEDFHPPVELPSCSYENPFNLASNTPIQPVRPSPALKLHSNDFNHQISTSWPSLRNRDFEKSKSFSRALENFPTRSTLNKP